MKKQNTSNALSLAYILINIGAAFGIVYFKDQCIIFLAILIANISWGSIWKSKLNKLALVTARSMVGLLFIYSGFVKGVDPLGTMYRIEDYFYAFNTVWAIPFAMVLGVLMIAAEFSLGVMILFNYRIRLSSGLITLMMLFFTVVTLNDALYSPVPDCGCFGDALIITNWQTFYKNLVINALLFPVFLNRKMLASVKIPKMSIVMVFVLIPSFIGFEFLNTYNLPVIDFRPWKVGNELYPKNPEPVKNFFIYQNKSTGEQQEYLSTNIPWKDTVFMANWEFVSAREEDPNEGKYNIFPMMDQDMNDLSTELVSDSGLVMFMVMYDILDVEHEVMAKFDALAEEAQAADVSFVFLTSNAESDIEKYKEDYTMGSYPIYFSDNTALKAAIRSNPGLIVVSEGVVLGKYHHRSLPSFDEIVQAHSK